MRKRRKILAKRHEESIAAERRQVASGNQSPALCERIRAKGIEFSRDNWEKPTVVIKDPDGNELFPRLPEGELASLESEMTGRHRA